MVIAHNNKYTKFFKIVTLILILNLNTKYFVLSRTMRTEKHRINYDNNAERYKKCILYKNSLNLRCYNRKIKTKISNTAFL